MKLKMLVAASALLGSGASIADSYQADVGATAVRQDIDILKSKENSYGVTGTYYFDLVKTSNVPLTEAAYLGKNSNVYAQAFRTSGHGDHNDFYEVGAEFYIPESFLYVEAGALRNTGNNVSRDYTDDDWYTRIGITPIDGLLLTTSYYHDEGLNANIRANRYYHDKGYNANISAKYVTALGAGEFINVEAEFRDDDDSTYKSIGTDYYFDRTFSVGGKLENKFSDYFYTLRTRKFFTEDFSGQLSYTASPEGDIASIGANIRF